MMSRATITLDPPAAAPQDRPVEFGTLALSRGGPDRPRSVDGLSLVCLTCQRALDEGGAWRPAMWVIAAHPDWRIEVAGWACDDCLRSHQTAIWFG